MRTEAVRFAGDSSISLRPTARGGAVPELEAACGGRGYRSKAERLLVRVSVDRARFLFAQHLGRLTNRLHIRIDRNGLLECKQRGANVAGAQADLTEAG